MSHEHNHDRIVYHVTLREGKVVACFFDKQQAREHAATLGEEEVAIVPTVVDVHELRQMVLAGLTPLERLVIDPPPRNPKRGEPPKGR